MKIETFHQTLQEILNMLFKQTSYIHNKHESGVRNKSIDKQKEMTRDKTMFHTTVQIVTS